MAASYKGRGVVGKATEAACGDLCGVYAAPHPHAQETNIPNIAYVEKIDACTWKQALRSNANAKHNAIHQPSCAELKASTSRKEKMLC